MDLIIDNVGFDVEAMAKMTEKEFVDTHMGTDAICWGKTPEEKKAWLKNAYKEIKGLVAKPAPAKTEE